MKKYRFHFHYMPFSNKAFRRLEILPVLAIGSYRLQYGFEKFIELSWLLFSMSIIILSNDDE